VKREKKWSVMVWPDEESGQIRRRFGILPVALPVAA
jgi:hypothetical protein